MNERARPDLPEGAPVGPAPAFTTPPVATPRPAGGLPLT
jgi:hypothetical protein